MECRKNRFEPANEPVEADSFYLFYHSCTYRLISLASSSGRRVLCLCYYLCLSLIYCLTHVECFRFFSWPLTSSRHVNCRQRAQCEQRLWRLCPPYCEREVGFQGHVTHMSGEITRFEASSQLQARIMKM